MQPKRSARSGAKGPTFRQREDQVEQEQARQEYRAAQPTRPASGLDEVLDNMADKFLLMAAEQEIALGKNLLWIKKALADTVAGSGMLEYRRADGTSKWVDGTGKTREPHEVGRYAVWYFFTEMVPYLNSVAEVIPAFTDPVTFKSILVTLDQTWRRKNLVRQTHEKAAETPHEYGLRWRDTPRHVAAQAAKGDTVED